MSEAAGILKPWFARYRFLQRVFAAATILYALLAGTAAAQIDPDDTGSGQKLGLAQLGNSGQVGTVSLFRRGSRRTLVVLDIRSVSAAEIEPAQIRRGHVCRTSPTRASAVLALNDVASGTSRTEIPVAEATLLSGNYLVEIFRKHRSAQRVSCGELHR